MDSDDPEALGAPVLADSSPSEGTLDPAVLRAALRVSRELDLGPCFRALVAEANRLCPASGALAYRYSASGFDLELRADTLPEEHELRDALALLDARVIDDEIPPAGRRLDEPGLLEPVTGWGGHAPSSALVLPLVADGERVALLVVLEPPAGEAERRVRELAAECGAALRSALAVQDLKDLMIRDDTAECFNRRHFDEHITGEVARAARFGGRLALIFLDMDNLKEINTRHGHSAGSQVLYEASIRINESIRSVDRLFRFGGDEFCIVLPETDMAGAREVAERVRRALARRAFLEESTGGEPLTASFGVAAYPDHGKTAEAVVEAADSAMRRIKQSRKNGIALSGEPVAGREVP